MPSISHYDDRSGVIVSFVWEEVEADLSLWDWWVRQLRAHFATYSGSYQEHDVKRYIDICKKRQLSRKELAEFVRQYSGPTPVRDIPNIPREIGSVVLCRDEERIKIAIWSAGKRYWEMRWSVPSA